MNEMEFIEEVCQNCDKFHDCDSFYDENNLKRCMMEYSKRNQ